MKIREILYANNYLLNDKEIINVDKNKDNALSTISIKNRNKLIKLKLSTNNTKLSFEKDVETYKSSNYNFI